MMTHIDGYQELEEKIIQKKIRCRLEKKRIVMNACLFSKSKEFKGFPPVMILEDFCGQMPVVTIPLSPLSTPPCFGVVFGLRWFCSVAFPFKTVSLSFIKVSCEY